MMMKRTGALLLLTLFTLAASAQRHAHHREFQSESANCFNPSDPDELRLWPGTAPGAQSDDPCRDIPYLKVYRAAPANPSGQAIIVIPGGGYDRLTDTKEQEPVAQYFAQQLGVTTFVLYYRLVQPDGTYRYPVPMWDAQRAIRLVRSRATAYGIAPSRIGLFGFSAGGHLATTITLHAGFNFNLPAHDAIDRLSAQPNLLGLGYPVISMDPSQFAAKSSHDHLLFGYTGSELDHLQTFLSGQSNITPNTPPVFLFESFDDQRISPQNSVQFVEAIKQAGLPIDAHLFQHGVHGAGLATGIPEESAWPTFFATWLRHREQGDPAPH